MPTIKIQPVLFALGDREQTTQSGVITISRPLYYMGRRIGAVDPDYSEVVMRWLLKAKPTKAKQPVTRGIEGERG